jgi:hypothetical protein
LTQTARFKDGSLHLLQQMPEIDLVPMDEPDDTALLIDVSGSQSGTATRIYPEGHSLA